MADGINRLLARLMGAEEDSGDEEEEELLGRAGRGSSSSGTEEEDGCADEAASREGEFDRSLPAQHLYLGELETERGVATMVDEEATPTLPLLCLPGRVLFPGETLPMHVYSPHLVQALRGASAAQHPVAIATDRRGEASYLSRPRCEELSKFGTTAEVLAFREEGEGEGRGRGRGWGGPAFVVKLLGRQRFRLLDVVPRLSGLVDARVCILPEEPLPPRDADLFTCPAHIYASCQATMVVARQPECTVQSRIELEQCRRRLRCPRLAASLCQVPRWAFQRYDTEELRGQLETEKEMKTFGVEEVQSRLPDDVTSLSYWLARRLPISDEGKLELLSLGCPTLRLLHGLHTLREFTELCCLTCETCIAKKENIFSMSVDGPLAAYVNPGGHVHDTLTVTMATNLRTQGRATTEHSWFPGYTWTIVSCRGCGQHKGWLFQARRHGLKPTRFYGLTRASLVLRST